MFIYVLLFLHRLSSCFPLCLIFVFPVPCDSLLLILYPGRTCHHIYDSTVVVATFAVVVAIVVIVINVSVILIVVDTVSIVILMAIVDSSFAAMIL